MSIKWTKITEAKDGDLILLGAGNTQIVNQSLYRVRQYIAKDLTQPQWEKIDAILNYLRGRGIGADWYDFMYSPVNMWDMDKRLLIPFYWKGDIVGYTGRIFEASDKVKYYTDVQPGYLFNMDAQDWTRKFVIVTE